MRAFDWETLADAWELDQGDPRRYVKPRPPMYTTAGEGGLSSPAVVNDVVLISTTKVALYAFNAVDGTPLWSDELGAQTLGFSGGYGYCLGPAVYGNYVVAGALVLGRDGGVLRIYGSGPIKPGPISVVRENPRWRWALGRRLGFVLCGCYLKGRIDDDGQL